MSGALSASDKARLVSDIRNGCGCHRCCLVHPFHGKVGVNLDRLQVGMAEQLLDVAQIDTAGYEHGGE
jgi:hypothetical protein